MLKPLNFHGLHFNVADFAKFKQAILLLRESLFDRGATMYASDNIITWNRNLSFLREDFFIDIIKSSETDDIEKSTIWRLYVLLYFANIASRIEGDFVELGCYKGHTVEHVIKRLDFPKLSKKYYLYDLFEWKQGDEHTRFSGHTETMYENVKARFSNYTFVEIIKGFVPDSLQERFPQKIAFAHIDMNHPVPEAGALEKVLPVLSPGGIIIFDDYGWWGYSKQKMALDAIIKKNGLDILELPTGQALLIKPHA